MTTTFDVECRKVGPSTLNATANSVGEKTKLRNRFENWLWNRDVQQRKSRRRSEPRKLLFVLFLFTTIVCIILVVISFKLFNGIKREETDKYNECLNVCLTEHCVTAAANLLSNMDSTVDPCDDFYEYACGQWQKKHPLPPDRSHYDTFSVMKDELKNTLRGLLEKRIDENDCNATSNAKKLFTSCMNETIIERRGAVPLLGLLDQFGGWPVLGSNSSNSTDWVTLMANLRLYNNDILIGQWVGTDHMNSSSYVIQLDQPELGMPSRDYYEDGAPQLLAYLKFMVKTAVLLGADVQVAESEMQAVLEFERNLAEYTIPNEERRNYSAIYNNMQLKVLQTTVPSINWTHYFSIVMPMTIDGDENIVVYALDYILKMVELVEQTSKRTVVNYLLWRFVYNRVSYLDKRFIYVQQEYFRSLYGVLSVPPRWKTCTSYVNKNMGMAVGSLFVRSHFNETSKIGAKEMIVGIKEIFLDILTNVVWMDEKTKDVAITKAKTMGQKIGFPRYILDSQELDADFDDIQFEEDKYFENVLNILQKSAIKEQLKLRSSVDKTQWVTSPAVVNAFYTRSKNVISFPAGILQPPLYHPNFPRSLNYGGIGVVIGHEITHGFDDKGSQFDHVGNLEQWWSKESLKNFHEKADCMVKQYSEYTMSDINMNVNGLNTVGENIADNGGIKQAYRAYLQWQSENNPEPFLPGLNLTHHQLFFLNYAQIWCGITRPEAAITSIRTAAHTPGRFRVIGTLSNFGEFARAFHCPNNTKMNPKKKCEVW